MAPESSQETCALEAERTERPLPSKWELKRGRGEVRLSATNEGWEGNRLEPRSRVRVGIDQVAGSSVWPVLSQRMPVGSTQEVCGELQPRVFQTKLLKSKNLAWILVTIDA